MSVPLKEIAQHTGLSIAAVSQALRGIGRISTKTREKVLKAAKSLGYQRDPLLSQAFSRMRQPSQLRYRETIALLTEWEMKATDENHRRIRDAAMKQSESMGYKLEVFTVSGNPREQRRVSRVLQARGIRGLIILPRLDHPQPRLHFDWDRFAAVAIGRTLSHPRNLDRVETGIYHKIIEALHLLKKVGYRRIGMAIEPAQNIHHRGAYYAAFLFSQLRLPARQRIPILAPRGAWNEKSFQLWMTQNKPDVLIAHAVVAPKIAKWLSAMNLRIPEDVSLFCVNILEGDWSGLSRDVDHIGQAAVEMLSLLLLNGKLGLPNNPRCLQIDEFWRPGKTLSRSIARYLSPEGVLKTGLMRPLIEKATVDD
ncbi:hypothetical protein BH09VER1_BH09VER1_28030 [soil metagenome]